MVVGGPWSASNSKDSWIKAVQRGHAPYAQSAIELVLRRAPVTTRLLAQSPPRLCDLDRSATTFHSRTAGAWSRPCTCLLTQRSSSPIRV